MRSIVSKMAKMLQSKYSFERECGFLWGITTLKVLRKFVSLNQKSVLNRGEPKGTTKI